MKNIPKQYMIVAAIVLVVLLVGGFIFMKNRQQAAKIAAEQNSQDEEEEVIPTVDPSVKVVLEPKAGNHELDITVSAVPDGTESIDYELSYDTEKQGLQGIIGTIEVKSGKDEVSKEVTLGTCSSGTCIYHDVVGKVKVSMKFNGSYGERVFEKDFSLDE